MSGKISHVKKNTSKLVSRAIFFKVSLLFLIGFGGFAGRIYVAKMEATFSLDSNREMKAFKGPMTKERMRGLLKIKLEALVEVVLLVLGSQFQEREVKRCSNLDIISMVIAWGLELSKPVDEVRFVEKTLFTEDMLGGLDFILD